MNEKFKLLIDRIVFNVDKNNDGRPDAAEIQAQKPKDPPKVQFPSVSKKEASHD